MLSSMLSEQSTVDIHLNEGAVYLHPTPLTDSSPSDDHLLSGSVVLTLSAPKRVKSIIVRLVGKYDISFVKTGVYESGKFYETEVGIINSHEEDRLFEQGVHSFAFTLIIPSSSAPYERSRYGRVNYRLSAVVQGPGLLGFRAMAERDVWVNVNLAGGNKLNEHYQQIEGFQKDIGPYTITTTSPHLTVGGLLSYNLSLSNPPCSLALYSALANLTTTYTLTSPSRPTDPPERVTQQRQIFLINSDHPPHATQSTTITTPTKPQNYTTSTHTPTKPLSELPSGEPYHLSHLTRLQNDDYIRPSTLPETTTPIRITHEISLELHYSASTAVSVTSKPDISILKTIRPIIISSCCCMLESFRLPSYSDAVNRPSYPTWPHKGGPCICQSSTEELIKEYRASFGTSAQYVGVGIKSEYEPMLARRE